MTTTTTRAAERPTADRYRNAAMTVGVLFVITYVTSIAAKFFLYAPLLDSTDYILTGSEHTTVLWGTFAEMILIVANIGTAVALYPVVRRRHRTLALGFVTARVMESVFIAVGVLSVLTIVSMQQDFADSADPEALTVVGNALVTLQEWTFNLGPGWVVGAGNGLILGYMMYRTGLVPRALAVLGLVGGSLIILQGTAIMFGLVEPGSAFQVVASTPEFFWELILGLYLIVKGFRPAAVLED